MQDALELMSGVPNHHSTYVPLCQVLCLSVRPHGARGVPPGGGRTLRGQYVRRRALSVRGADGRHPARAAAETCRYSADDAP